MTVRNQNLPLLFAGDAQTIQIAIVDGTGAALDVSTVSDIVFTLEAPPGGKQALLRKTKAAGQIVFVNTGVDGLIAAALADGDTSGLDGDYPYTVRIVDAQSKRSTVTTGFVPIAAVAEKEAANALPVLTVAETGLYIPRSRARKAAGDAVRLAVDFSMLVPNPTAHFAGLGVAGFGGDVTPSIDGVQEALVVVVKLTGGTLDTKICIRATLDDGTDMTRAFDCLVR